MVWSSYDDEVDGNDDVRMESIISRRRKGEIKRNKKKENQCE